MSVAQLIARPVAIGTVRPVCSCAVVIPDTVFAYVLLENSDHLLLESGDSLLLEG